MKLHIITTNKIDSDVPRIQIVYILELLKRHDTFSSSSAFRNFSTTNKVVVIKMCSINNVTISVNESWNH
jgi:hypothetical protein